jgi:hypothetical protein
VVHFIEKFFQGCYSSLKVPKEKILFPKKFHSEDWWMTPLSRIALCNDESLRKLASETIFTPIFKYARDVFPAFFQCKLFRYPYFLDLKNYHSHERFLHAKISVLKAAKLANLLPNEWISHDNPERFLDSSSMLRILQHSDLALRGDAFALLCDSSKAAADLTDDELELIKTCLSISMDCQVPSFRQYLTGSLKKMFLRLKMLVFAYHRNRGKAEKYLNQLTSNSLERSDVIMTQKTEIDRLRIQLQRKADFIQWFYDFIIGSLFPGASFQRSSFALELLSKILEWDEKPIDKSIIFSFESVENFPSLSTTAAQDSLLHFIIHGDYEPDRLKAFEIYKKLISKGGDIQNGDFILEKALFLVRFH